MPARLIPVFAAVMGVLALAAPAHAAPGATPETALAPTPAPNDTYALDSDMAPDGTAAATWLGRGTDAGKVFVATRPPGGTWTAGQPIASDFADLVGAEIELGPDGSAIVVVTTSSFQNGRPYAFYRTSAGVWSSSPHPLDTVDRATSQVHARAAYDPAGNLTVAWRSSSEILVASRPKLSGMWTDPTLVAQNMSSSTVAGFDVDVDKDGNATVAWGDGVYNEAEGATQQDVFSSTRSGPAGAWSDRVKVGSGIERVANPGRQVNRVELDVNEAGQAVVVWQGWTADTNDRRVRAAMRDTAGGAWVAEQQVSTSGQVALNELGAGIDGQGNALVVWANQNTNEMQQTGRSAEGAWSTSLMSATAAFDGTRLAFEMNEAGAYMAAWLRSDESKRVVARTPSGTVHSYDIAPRVYESYGIRTSLDAAGNGLLGYSANSGNDFASPVHFYVQGWDAAGPALTNLLVPTAPEAGKTLSFSVDPADVWSSAADIDVTWDFGDESTDATGTDVTHTYGADGTYTVTVTATDAAGNATTATRQVVVQPDQPPVVEITDGHPSLSNDDDPSFTWTVDDAGATVTCTLEGPAGVLGPHAAAPCAGLSRTYSDLADGDYAFTVAAEDGNGNIGDTTVNFTIDTARPTTTAFTGGPDDGDRIRERRPTFTFSATGETGPEFECRYDSTSDEDWELCDDDGWQPPALDDGAHTVEVRAIDLAGNADATPEAVTFVVDNVSPDTAISGPASPTRLSQLSFTLSSTGLETGETASYACRFFKAGTSELPGFAACEKDLSRSVPAGAEHEGTWTIEAIATDEAGNADGTAATASVVVDRTAPAAPAIDSGPDGATPDRTPTFTFTGEQGASLACRIQPPGPDVTAFEPCDAGSYTPSQDLADKTSYTFHVRATDGAGNTGVDAARAFSVSTVAVDTTAPQTRIDDGPGEGASTTDRTPSFAFSAVDGDGAAFRCSLHRAGATAAPADCASPFTPASDLSLGEWVFEVAARDAAGNWDETPARRTFSVVEPAVVDDGNKDEPKREQPKPETPQPQPQPPAAQTPAGFVPMAEAVSEGRMPALSPKQTGGRWAWRHAERAEADLAALGLNLRIVRKEMGAEGAQPKSLRTQLRREDDAPGAVMVQDPPAGAPLRSTPTAPVVVTLAVFDPAKDKAVEEEIDDDLAAAERRLERAGKKIPRCKYLLYSADNLMMELGAMTPNEARAALRKERCDHETRFRKGLVADEVISDVREDEKNKAIELFVLTPKQSQFVITVREEPDTVDANDLSFAIGDGSSEWSLRTSDTQDNVFVAQVNELATGRFVTGAKVELWEPGDETPAFRGTTDGNGEVTVRGRIRTPGTLGLFAKVRDAEGDVMEGFRDLRAVTRKGSFTTPTGRTMKEGGGRWKGPKGTATGLVPANAGMGIAGPTVTTATVTRRPVTFAVQTKEGPGLVPGQAPTIDLTKGSRLVLAGDGVLIASGGPTLSHAGAAARSASTLGDGPRARAAFLDVPLLGALAGNLLYHYLLKPRLTTPIVAAAVKKADRQVKPPVPQIKSVFTQGQTAGAVSKEGGEVVDLGTAQVIGLGEDKVVIRAGGVVYTLAASQVIAVGGGNFDVTLQDGSLLKLSGVIATGGGNLIGQAGGNVISVGGGNVIATGGGNVIATGGGNVIATGGGNVIATGGGNVIATGGGNVISVGGGNLIGQAGGNLIGQAGGNVIATGGGNLIGQAGGNLIGQAGGNFMPAGAGVIAVGGGNLIGQAGGNVIAVGGGNVIATGGGN